MAENEAMAALVSMKSARERIEKSTGDFDGTDGKADDDGTAEVAEGRVLMVEETGVLPLLCGVVTKAERGDVGSMSWLLVVIVHSSSLHNFRAFLKVR
jgi:hypothetical protein